MKRTFAVLAASVVVVLALYTAVSRAGVAYDLTEEGSATLSDATLRLLDRVDHRLHITAFFPRESPGRVEAATVLSRYRDANRRITFRVMDPNTFPGEAQRLGVEEIGNTAVEDLSDDDVEVAQFAIEIDVTSAIARLLRDAAGTVCFAKGHGERRLGDDDPKGLATAAAHLERNGYTMREIDLFADPSVPRGCEALVIAAADTRFGSDARRALVAYLRAAGKLAVLADPDADADLSAVTEDWGIRFVRGVVVEGDDGSHLPDDLTAPIISRYAGGSPVVRGVGPAFFPRVMSVVARPSDHDAGLTTTELARTSAVSYLDRNDFADFDPDVDREGPVVVGASADDSEVRSAGTEGAEIRRTRIVAWGDVDFATNGFIGDGDNATLWVQTIDWLTQPEDLVTAVPSFPEVRELQMTAQRSRYVLYLMAGVVPGLFVIAGLMVWVVRRSR